MEVVAAVRHAVLVLGRSRRWAARTFKIDRKTVNRYVDGDVEVGKRRSPARPAPRREAAVAELPKLIAETAVAKKQQLTAKRAHELLEERGVDVGYTIVKEVLAERRRAAAEVHVPLEYKPGKLAEIDFFEVEVDVDGVRTTAFLFVMRLMYSGRDFACVFPRQDQVCFLEGHVRAFAHFDAVPERAAYDNLKAAVRRHLVGSERELTARMLAATVHYVFEASFCRPYTGHDKGGVEARGKNIRLQSMVPVPSGVTLDEISAKVLADVEKRFWEKADSQKLWETELSGCHALASRPFDSSKTEVAVPVSSRSLVIVEGATYSVPSAWARLTVTTHAGVSEIEMVGPRGESVVRQRIPKGERDIDYAAHYLEVLATKPAAPRPPHALPRRLCAQRQAPFARREEAANAAAPSSFTRRRCRGRDPTAAATAEAVSHRLGLAPQARVRRRRSRMSPLRRAHARPRRGRPA